MSKWQAAEDFIAAVQDKTSAVNPIYRRHFSELIKLIPLVGSVIEANTIGAIEDSILAERLRNLESACSRALTTEDAGKLTEEIQGINSIFFVLLVTGQRHLLDQTQQMADELKRTTDVASTKLANWVHKKFLLVTISGPSAVGKDCVLDTILSRADSIDRPIEALTKFTNRPRRLVDSKYYDFISNEECDILEQSKNVIFPYYKRGYRYGFDRTHLFSSAREPQILFSIFTHFASLPTDREYLQERGINHCAILLRAERDMLIRRSGRRLLAPADIEARNISIDEDMAFLDVNTQMVDKCFDLVVDNGDAMSVNGTCDTILQKLGLASTS